MYRVQVTDGFACVYFALMTFERHESKFHFKIHETIIYGRKAGKLEAFTHVKATEKLYTLKEKIKLKRIQEYPTHLQSY